MIDPASDRPLSSSPSLPAAPDLVLVTLDALRLDVAEEALRAGETPFLAGLLPEGW